MNDELVLFSLSESSADRTHTPQVHFSNDKTSYTTRLSASFLQSGRKGIFAACESQMTAFAELVSTREFSVARPHVGLFLTLLLYNLLIVAHRRTP